MNHNSDYKRIIESYAGAEQDALLPLLHDIQDAAGYIPAEAVPAIAKTLNLSRAEVHGVLTYYHHFRQTPAGRHVIRVCCAESCQSMGAQALTEHAQRHLANKNLTIEPVYCLGLCSISPAVQIDEESLHGHVTTQRFDQLVAMLDKDQQ